MLFSSSVLTILYCHLWKLSKSNNVSESAEKEEDTVNVDWIELILEFAILQVYTSIPSADFRSSQSFCWDIPIQEKYVKNAMICK